MNRYVKSAMALLCHIASFSFVHSEALQPGDIAIIGLNTRDPDQFSFITLVEIEPATVIHFTDCGWNSLTESFRPNEGLVTYTAPATGLAMGSIITFGIDPGFTVSGVSGFWGLSTAGDQIIVFQGNINNPTFIYAVNNQDNEWQSSAVDNNTSGLPPDLQNGLTAVALIEYENNIFDCTKLSGLNREDILSAISNPANWIGQNTNRYNLPPIGCGITGLQVDLSSFNIDCSNNEVTGLTFCAKEQQGIQVELLKYTETSGWLSVGQYKIAANACLYYEDRNAETCAYQLKITDWEGATSYSKIKTCTKHNEIKVYPNPSFNQEVHILSTIPLESIEVRDIMGKLLFQMSGHEITDEKLSEKLSVYSQGLYILSLYYQDKIETIEFIQY